MIRDPSFHCGGDSERLMNPAEIIVGKVQCKSFFEIRPLLRESIRQPVNLLIDICMVRFFVRYTIYTERPNRQARKPQLPRSTSDRNRKLGSTRKSLKVGMGSSNDYIKALGYFFYFPALCPSGSCDKLRLVFPLGHR